MRIFRPPSSLPLAWLIGSLGVLLTVGAMAVGAALFSWLGPEEEPTKASVMESPNLSESQVLGLVNTYFDTLPSVRNYDVCREKDVLKVLQGNPDSIIAEILQNFQAMSANYQGEGHWLVSNHLCKFIVDDDTGKVVRP